MILLLFALEGASFLRFMGQPVVPASRCWRFSGFPLLPSGCACASDLPQRSARSLPLEREVPNIVAEPLTTFFEAGDDAIGRPWDVCPIRGQIEQPGVGSKRR